MIDIPKNIIKIELLVPLYGKKIRYKVTFHFEHQKSIKDFPKERMYGNFNALVKDLRSMIFPKDTVFEFPVGGIDIEKFLKEFREARKEK